MSSRGLKTDSMKNYALPFLVLVVLLFSFGACTGGSSIAVKQACELDKEFVLNYENCLLVVLAARSGFSVDFKDRFRAVECLEAITGYRSHIIKYSDAPYLLYKIDKKDPSRDLFDSDLRVWLSWIENNQCYFNMAKAEKVFHERELELGDKIAWPDFFCPE